MSIENAISRKAEEIKARNELKGPFVLSEEDKKHQFELFDQLIANGVLSFTTDLVNYKLFPESKLLEELNSKKEWFAIVAEPKDSFEADMLELTFQKTNGGNSGWPDTPYSTDMVFVKYNGRRLQIKGSNVEYRQVIESGPNLQEVEEGFVNAFANPYHIDNRPSR